MKRLATLIVALIPAAVGCSQSDAMVDPASLPTVIQAAPSAEPVVAAAAGALTLVSDPSMVCMVNNQYMGKAQIPVDVNGTTYYGCCEMCKGKLANDPSSRSAVDPVSQREVDKAVAVMGQDKSGTVYYFENAKNLAKYSKQLVN